MYTLYKINTDELNENFISAIKAQFPHQTIEIAISELAQQQDLCTRQKNGRMG